MSTTRRLLECGHVKRMWSGKWQRLSAAGPIEAMHCSTCQVERKIVGMVPMKPQPVRQEAHETE